MFVNRKPCIAAILVAVCIGLLIVSTRVSASTGGIRVKAQTRTGATKEIRLYSGYYALVIGCADYRSGRRRLPSPVDDARKIASTLKSLGWTVKVVENPDGRTLERSIWGLVFSEGRDKDKAIFLWFSGHGHTIDEADGTGLGYLVPVDAPDPGTDPVGFTEKAISMRQIETVSKQIRSRHVLMVFDACLSGDIFQMVEAKPSPHIEEKVAYPVRQFIIAGTEDEQVPDKSMFNQVFIQGIQDGSADLNQDRYITCEEVGAYLQEKVILYTRGAQHPKFGRINNPKLDKGDFVLVASGGAAAKDKRPDISPQKQEKLAAGEKITNSLGMTFVYIPPGNFMMGSPLDEPGRDDDEIRHRVTLTRGFYLQTTEVTQGQWRAVMGFNPSNFAHCGDDCPVETVTWQNVQAFIQALNRREGGSRYRLPTEAEWEYACRAGSNTAIYTGDLRILGKRNAPALNAIAWHGGNSCIDCPGGSDCSDLKEKRYSSSKCGPHPVGRKVSNALGLYDMLGNVYEWCQDWYGKYPPGPLTDPTGPVSGSRRVARGGSWNHYARSCRSANRNHFSPRRRSEYLGFRLLIEP